MTQLLVHDLGTYLAQDFTVLADKRIIVEAVRPYLYFHNSPSGTFTLSLYKGATLIDSASITSSEIQTALATSNNYFHAYSRFDFENHPVLNEGAYTLKLTASGYINSSSSYIGWVALHEDLINNITYTPNSDSENPLTFQLWGYRWLG